MPIDRTIARALLFAVLALATLAVLPAKSQASAYGYQYWGTFMWKDIPIPKGQLVHAIEGDGRHIDRQGANYISYGNLCDTSLKFTYGYGSHFWKTPIKRGCRPVRAWKYKFDWTVPRGKACAELWMDGWRRKVTKQCHFVD